MKKCELRTAVNILVCSFMAGCAASAPNSAADYGPYPQDYRQIVDNWMRDKLTDPHSVVDLEISQPQEYVARRPLVRPTYGYLVQIKFNAKNAFGGYVGRHGINVLIRNGNIVNSWEQESG
jgi:hypothetical protein